jgi:hypothetical protein
MEAAFRLSRFALRVEHRFSGALDAMKMVGFFSR